ncbi:MAG TPA: DNA-3-methyladenine glycosylase [Acidimicrobiales bacterium]|nr:DNA-3-methyladenine glycosylase [Acidimicrobiales bacterium]
MPRSFYDRDATEVATDLLNKLVVAGGRAGRIVEVEAYRGSEDAASHAFRGPSRRNATMFGPPGHLYVYFSYGVHWCANAVCLPRGTAHAVLLRALAPVEGVEEMRVARRGAPRDRDLCSGPGRLCQALGINGDHDGVDLVTGSGGVAIRDDGMAPPAGPGVGPRVGIRQAADLPLRFWVPGDPSVSRTRPGPRPRRVRSSPPT